MIFKLPLAKIGRGGEIPPKPKDIPRNKSTTKNMPTLLYAPLQIDLGG